jgi:deoxyribodipyrimidine photo-lyase
MNYHWFRRDLRLNDNAALFQALKSGETQCIFIFDSDILNKLSKPKDARVLFIYQEISRLKKELKLLGSDLRVEYGKPLEVWQIIINEGECDHIYTNRDYEPYARERDGKLAEMAKIANVGFSTFKDQCIFEMYEITKDDGLPYTVFTPYMRKWKVTYTSYHGKAYPTENYYDKLKKTKDLPLIKLESMGFEDFVFRFPEKSTNTGTIKNYEKWRDIPSVLGTSRLSLHFRFGTISIREKLRKGLDLSEKWVNELIWRDFYMQILYHFPHVVGGSFKPQYDNIEWRNNEAEFEAWKKGQTGYPIIDAGMRELNTTGFMHNRVRMIVASFLTKHLLIDWRWGEAYFAEKLLDFELSSNNGGWQWAAGSGCDAAPYFRVFNPYLQTEKFDKEAKYIKQWVKEYDTINYPKPIVEHKFARDRCLAVYKKGLAKE